MAAYAACGGECRIVTGAAGTSPKRHWTSISGTPGIETTTIEPGGGSAALSFPPNAFITQAIPAGKRTFTARFYFRWVGALPSALCTIMRYTVTGNSTNIRVQPSGQVLIQHNGVSTNVGSPITADTWHYVDFRVDFSANPWTAAAALDGGTSVPATNAALAAIDMTSYDIGQRNTTTETLLIDHFIIYDDNAVYPIGPGYIKGYVPGATSGTHNQTAGDLKNEVPANITNGDASSLKIDELPANTTDYVAQTVIRTSTYYEAAYATSGETATPRAVEQVVSVVSSAATADTQKAQLYDGTSAADAYALATAGATTPINYSTMWGSAPSGGAWTLGKFQAAKIRWGFSDDVTPNPRLTSTILEAEFAPAAPSARAKRLTLLGVT